MSNLSDLCSEEALPPINVSVNKKKRSLPGRPDPDAEVIALSPKSLMTTNRFVCEICNKGFQRDQNLQLHRRGHNLPWRLKQKESHECRKKVYICPELNCVHHDPARALGDLTGIKKHFSRKHGEKKWKCEKCSKRYAVQSDWKAHQKTCGTKEYRCECGTLFSRKDSFITHRAFCDVLENGKDPKCIEGESQKSTVSLDENGYDDSFGMDDSAPVEVASSPISQATGDALASSDFSKSILAERASDVAIPERGIASLSLTWMQGGIGANNGGPSQGPGLSLCLGTGPGPGPPGGLQVMGSQTASVPPFKFSSSIGLNKIGFSQLANSDSQFSSKHVPSTGAMGMLANLFSSSAHRQSGDSSSDAMEQVSNYGDYEDSTLSVLPAGLSTSVSSMMDDSRSVFGPSKTYHHTVSASTSATALLQKAAQMGAKASNPSMLQKYGMGVRDSSFSMTAQGMPREAPWAGFGNIVSGSMSMPSKVKQDGDFINNGERQTVALKEVMGSSLPGMSSQIGPPTNGNSFLKHGILSEIEGSSTLHSRSSFGDGAGRLQQNCGGHQRDENDKKMVDFLGIGGASGLMMTRNSTGMGQILSHRDLASITSLTAGIKVQKRFPHPGSKVG
eukprot:c23258_g1_i1 orf=973-2829(+)